MFIALCRQINYLEGKKAHNSFHRCLQMNQGARVLFPSYVGLHRGCFLGPKSWKVKQVISARGSNT